MIVVAARDAQGQVRSTTNIQDPRIVRAESAGPTQQLTGVTFLRATTDFILTIPDDPAVVSLTLLKPRWTGQDFALDPLLNLNLP